MTVPTALALATLAVVLGWLGWLTLAVLRQRRTAGEPVYRRMPDGRLRFEWAIGTAYASTRRTAFTPPAGPGPAGTPDRRARAVPARSEVRP